jgi:hypothetical protein
MSFFNKTMSAADHKRKAYDIYMESPDRATDRPRVGYPVPMGGYKNQPKRESYKLKKRKEDRIRKNKRNSRGRAQTQGAGLGAVNNILGG